MKCPKCGTINLEGTEKCKNCEFPLNQYNMTSAIQVNKTKNSILIVLFNLLYCFIIPIILLLAALTRTNILFGVKIILFIFASLTHILGECISCLNTIKIVKNKENIKKTLSWYELGALICYIPIFYSISTIEINYLWIFIFLVLFKFISYVFTVKFFLKEEIKIKVLPIIILAFCYIMSFLIPNFTNPTDINKSLYKVFGNRDFDSKELKIKLVDEYNSEYNYDNDISYFHKFTEEELENITNLEINKETNDVTIKDLSKLTNLQRLSIKQLKIKNDFNLSYNKKLTVLNIDDVSFDKNFTIDENSNIKEIYIENSKFKDININSESLIKVEAENCKVNNVTITNSLSLKEFYLIKSKVNNVILDGNENLRSLGLSKTNSITIKNMGSIKDFFDLYKDEYGSRIDGYLLFKELVFEDKKITFENDEYIKFDGALYVKKDSLVKDLLLENLTAKVFDYYHEVIRENADGSTIFDSERKVKEQGLDSGLGDELHLYENDKEILNCNIYDLDEYDMED